MRARDVKAAPDRLFTTLAVALIAHVGLLTALPRGLPPVRSADRFFTVDDLVGIDRSPPPAERDAPNPRSMASLPALPRIAPGHGSSPARSFLRNARPPGTIRTASATSGTAEPVYGVRSNPPATRARLATPEACRRFFPSEARDDAGIAVMSVRVGETGTASAPRLLEELPSRQGFGRAALGCASLLRFEPARSEAGDRMASMSVVKLRFTRPKG